MCHNLKHIDSQQTQRYSPSTYLCPTPNTKSREARSGRTRGGPQYKAILPVRQEVELGQAPRMIFRGWHSYISPISLQGSFYETSLTWADQGASVHCSGAFQNFTSLFFTSRQLNQDSNWTYVPHWYKHGNKSRFSYSDTFLKKHNNKKNKKGKYLL